VAIISSRGGAARKVGCDDPGNGGQGIDVMIIVLPRFDGMIILSLFLQDEMICFIRCLIDVSFIDEMINSICPIDEMFKYPDLHVKM